MWIYYPPQLAKLLTQERIDDAQRSRRGYCCVEDRAASRTETRPTATTPQANLCTC